MPCRPIALIMPAGVSTMRGGGWPWRSFMNRPFETTPPSDRQIDDLLVLEAVAEAAAGRDQRVGQRQRAERDREIGSHQSHTSSAPSNTGPLMHERTRFACSSPCLTGTTQL